MNPEILRQLQRQLKFLEKSSIEYDGGDTEEAIRIATALRVLFHDTKSSVSIFEHLKQKDKLYIPSTLNSIEEQAKHFLETYRIRITEYNPPIMMVNNERKPPFNSWGINKVLTFDQWWNENILRINDEMYSRKDIICLSTNQDGGAHFDLKPKTKTKLLKDGTGRIKYKIGKAGTEQHLKDNHFLFLRQFAYEVLSAKKIYELNNIEFKEPSHKTVTYTGLLIEAEDLIKKSNYLHAKDTLLSAIKYSPSRKEAYNNIGCIYENLSEQEVAITNYNKAIEIDEKYIDPLYNLSLIYYKSQRYDLALEIGERILKINKKEIRANKEYQHVLQKFTEADEILFQYNNIFLKSENKTYLYLLCSGLYNIGEFDFALIVCNKISTLYRNDALLLTFKGLISIKLGKYNNAKEFFHDSEKFEIVSIEACYNILEYKLIFEKGIDGDQFRQYEIFFKEHKNSIIIDMFKILFHALDGNNIDKETQVFSNTYKNEYIKYNFNDLEKWVKKFQLKNVEKPLFFFANHQN